MGDEQRRDRKQLYVEILTFLAKCNATIRSTKPVFAFAGAPDPPQWPNDDSLHTLEARVAAFGSNEVRELMGKWLGVRSQFINDAITLDLQVPPRDAWEEIEAHRKELFELYAKIKDRINVELAAPA